MKKYIIYPAIFFLTTLVCTAQSEINYIGTWQAVRITLPATFSYDNESKKLTTSDYVDKVLAMGSKEEAEAQINNLKKTLPEAISKFYLELNANKTYKLFYNNQKTTGTFKSFASKSLKFNTTETDFVQFVENYDYNGGLILTPDKGETLTVNYKSVNNQDTFTITVGEPQVVNVAAQTARIVFVLKKVSSSKAASLKEEQNNFEDQKRIEDRKAADKKVSDDIAANGEIFITADKLPVIENEAETTKKITINLTYAAYDMGEESGTFNPSVTFVVEKDGSLTDINVTNVSELLKKTVVKEVKRFKIAPAEDNGERVRFRMKKDFKFTIMNE